ncbi:hypothetical protein BJ742DRAFT_768575 [Cladochytrium replicatum]|nr:hypothetical protein BJ742DRAFT_768575 [Cladochytrium replicatum]
MTKPKNAQGDPAAFLSTQEGKELMNNIGAVSHGLKGVAAFLRKVLDGTTGLALPDKAKRKTAVKIPKAKRDPNLPRRPPSSFLMFMDDMRKKAVAEGTTKISKLEMGALWRDLDKTSRDAYEKRYTEAYKNFEEERSAWEAEHGPMSHPRKRKADDEIMEDASPHSTNVTPVAAALEEVKPAPPKKQKQTAKAKPEAPGAAAAVPAVVATALEPVARLPENTAEQHTAKTKKAVTVVSPPKPAGKKSKGSDTESSLASPTAAVMAAQVLTSAAATTAKAKPAKANGGTKATGVKSDDDHPAPSGNRQPETAATGGEKKKKKVKQNASE